MINHCSAAQIADDVAQTPNSWTFVITPAHSEDSFIEELYDELHFIFGDDKELGDCVRLDARQTDIADGISKQSPNDVVLVTGIGALGDEALKHLDLRRNQMVDGPRVVLLGGPTEPAHLRSMAPNLWSWISPVYYLDDTIPLDMAARLNSLRHHFGMSDQEVLQMAKEGRLPTDPPFVEWLVLLGHGGLLYGR